MDSDSVKIFLSAITNSELFDGGDWIRTNCPLAPHTHERGTDRSPSFGISVNDDDQSVYYCFACSDKAQPLPKLLHNIWLMTGEYPHEAGRVLSGSLDISLQNSYKDIWERNIENIIPEPIPVDCFETIPCVIGSDNPQASFVIDYFEKRGISQETIEYYGIRFWEKNGSMVFPYMLRDGYVYGLRQRNLDVKLIYTITSEMLKHKEIRFYTPKETGVWFGLDKVDMSKAVVLVEGEPDVMRLHTLGLTNAIGSGTSNITSKQFSMLTCTKVYIGYDCDRAGLKARRKIYDKLYDKMIMFDIDWTLVGCEDAGDLKNKDDLKMVIKKANRVTENYFV